MFQPFFSQHKWKIIIIVCFSIFAVVTQDNPGWTVAIQVLRGLLKLLCLVMLVLSVVGAIVGFWAISFAYTYPFVTSEDRAKIIRQKRGPVVRSSISLLIISVVTVLAVSIILSRP